ncbi:T9SS type A sorting domain-containing protein [Cytophaga aurantiaca]|uniref:T9SS type A sorting domain-containing protein n=1 Tax=Cytophaga aurantiaca TaxID=29530 RepID=UPI00036B8E8B|nr:T9SS type A sorting domain-containing protein [Cytophaga aurantiaca]
MKRIFLFILVSFFSTYSSSVFAQQCWKSVSVASGQFMDGIKDDGTLWTWGSRGSGQKVKEYNVPSDYSYYGVHVPRKVTNVPPSAKWKMVANGILAIQENGTLWSWNAEGAYQIGTDTDWDTVSTSYSFAVLLKTDGSMWGWGNNQFKQFGDTLYQKDAYTHDPFFPYPIRIGTDTDWKHAYAGVGSILAIKQNGTLWCWGSGNIGNGTFDNSYIPIQVGTDTDWAMGAIGAFHCFALKTNGTLWCWGENTWGQLGYEMQGYPTRTPIQMGTDTDWKFITSADYYNAALKTDNTLWTWGKNDAGQLGTGYATNYSSPPYDNVSNHTPAQVGTATNWVYISTGSSNMAAIQSDGTLSTWGTNQSNQLGRPVSLLTDPLMTDSYMPVSVTCAEPVMPIVKCGVTLQNKKACATDQSITLAPTFEDYAFISSSNIDSIKWSSNGTGTFSNKNYSIVDYNFSAQDRINGYVNITVTASGINCSAMTAIDTITIYPAPTLVTSVNESVCGDTIRLHATISNTDNIIWTSGGTGTFSSHTSNQDSVTYYASAADLVIGEVMIYVYVNRDVCPYSFGRGTTLHYINTVNAGLDKNICAGSAFIIESASTKNTIGATWSSTGTGTFSPNATSLNPTYQPSAADIAAGTVTLTLTTSDNQSCAATSDQTTLTIIPTNADATADAGADQTICGQTVILSGDVTNSSGGFWSTNGTGTFNPGAHYLNTTYTLSSADLASNTIVLTLTPNNICNAVTSDDLTVHPSTSTGPQANAGADMYIQSNETANLSGTASGSSGIIWTSTGTGIFSNNTALTTTYTPSPNDIQNGSVELILTTTGNGACSPAQDRMYLAIGTTYSITGFVYAGQNLLDQGTVNLFKQTGNTISFIQETQVISGRYSFAHLPAGIYFVQGYPSVNSAYHNLYLPTYSGGHANWYYQNSIVIGNVDMAYILSLQAAKPSNTLWNSGRDTIAGTVYMIGNTQTLTASSGKPAAHITVFLTTTQGDTLTSTQTDSNGRFVFSNVIKGDYAVVPNFPGITLTDNQQRIYVSTDGTGTTIEDASMQIEKQPLVTGFTSATNTHTLNAYPNPAHTTVSVNIDGILYGNGTISIMDETGVVKLQQEVDFNSPVITFSIDALPAGIYMMHISSEENTYISKVVKF